MKECAKGCNWKKGWDIGCGTALVGGQGRDRRGITMRIICRAPACNNM